ncbi:Peptide synthetase [Collimonas arenae]|uniref:Peptide synthetase n=1 Tax=Collimonas arenae TaxID=279058 RepID=A0A0A1FFD2_9BURK|nr:non-ribosomal peptide synthetase [Collimonas arenae]AIY42364.1 Peptide synthetase [Collimonas arenae]
MSNPVETTAAPIALSNDIHMSTHELSSVQQVVWLDQMLNPAIPYYNIGLSAVIDVPVDPSILQQAIHEFAMHNDASRLVLVKAPGVARQRILPSVDIVLKISDFSGEADAEQRARDYVEQVFKQPFDLYGGLLWKTELVCISPSRYLWLLCYHHLVADGISTSQSFASIASGYNRLLGLDTTVAEAAPSYLDFIAKDRDYATSSRFALDKEFWRSRFAQLPARLVNGDSALAAKDLAPSEQVYWSLSRAQFDQLTGYATEHGFSASDFVLALISVYFARIQDLDEVIIGVPVHNRGSAREKATFGMFSSIIPVWIALDRQQPFAQAMAAVAKEMRRCYRHQRFPIAEINRALNVVQNGYRQLFDVSLSFEVFNTDFPMAGGMASGVKLDHGYEQTPLAMSVRDFHAGQDVLIVFDYNTRHFTRDEVVAIQSRMALLMDAILAGADSAIEQLPLLTAVEREQIVDGWNATRAEYATTLLPQLFETQAEQTPQALAVEQGLQQLSYAELNRQANQLAHYLRELGVQPEDRVAICVERSVAMVVGMLAVLKAGAAYVPLDPAYPADRLTHMLSDSAPRVVLTQGGISGAWQQVRATIAADLPVLDLRAPSWTGYPQHNPDSSHMAPSDLAYVIYTSGSTGLPKGVMVEHRNLVNLVHWHCDAFDVKAGQRTSCVARLGFDAAVWEIWPALSAGASLLLPERDDDAATVLAWWRQQSLDVGFLPTPMAEYALRNGIVNPQLRHLLTGGDRLRYAPQNGLPFSLINNYGPTEATVVATSGRLTSDDGILHIGRPIANTQVYLLDAQGEPVPVGVTGELYIGGAGVARGYLNQSELTEQRFVPDRFSSVSGARLYKSGDLARWQADGTLVYLGRNDFQVKLRGFRIELGEIEAQLAAHPAISETVVIVREDTPGDQRLVAYIVVNQEAETETLRTHLSNNLPDYMVPAAYVTLASLPLTANGKLDRKNLPAPDSDAYALSGFAPPQGETEIALAAIWAELLQIERIGRHDNFFSLGGHSLLAVTLMERMRQQGLQAEVRALFAAPTLAGLASAIGVESGLVTVPANLIPPDCATITPAMLPLVNLSSEEIARVTERVPGGATNVQDIYPLAPLQEGILLHHLMAKEGDPYLLVGMTGFDTRERLQAYLAALQNVIQRHDVLRTAIVWEGVPEPLQVVWRNAPLVQEELILDPADGDVARQLRDRFDPRHIRIDLSQAPLIRTSFAYDSVQRRWVLLTLIHHLINDHTTLEVVREEIAAHLQGQEALLPAPLQFRNYVAQARLGRSIAQHEDFFREMLNGVDETTAPFGLLEVHGDGDGLEEDRVHIGVALSQRLRRQARQLGVSAASLCHLAWAQVLARVASRSDVVFGTVLFGRMQGGEGADRMMGLLINTLPLRINIDQQSVADSVRRTHALLVELMEHEHASLALAQRASAIVAPQPLFSALLNYRHSVRDDASPAEQAAWQGITQISGEERSNYPLGMSIDDLGSDFALTAQVTPEIGARRVCSFMETALEGLVNALETTPQRAINSIDVLPAAERHQIVSDWNVTQQAHPGELLPQLFEAQAIRTPEAVAVTHGAEQLTYAELNRQANQLAHYLRELGVQPDDRVAICVERGVAMVVGLLAVLKAGAAYVPLDPAYPADRLTHMLNDSAPRVVLTQGGIGGSWQQVRATVAADLPVLELQAPGWSAYPEHNPDHSHLRPSNLAYIIYTSGSTGTPKGVMVEHRNVTRLFAATDDWFHFDAEDVWSLFHSFAFDFSVWEIWGALLHGGRLLVVPLDIARSAEDFYRLLCQEKVTILNQTPSAFRQLIAAQGASAESHRLRHVIFGGEALEPSTLAPWYAQSRNSNTKLINMYGITETTVHVTYQPITAADSERGGVSPIGVRIPDLSLYLLDAQGEPVPVGVAGEMHVGGAGVARGYMNRPDLTEQRFIADRFSSVAGARLYKSGDLARWQADGTLVYLGRNDFQVKIRGFRIELGEIETQLESHPAIREAVVIAREDTPGDKRLVAYIVVNPHAATQDAKEASAETLRAHLSNNLPDYMVPAAYVTLASLPLTANGKLDRKGLPAPAGDAYAASGYVAPQGETEIALAAIWTELLQIGRIGRHDNFFSLGGHSLLAVTLMERMRQQGLQAEVRALFVTPTLAGLAAAIGVESGLVTVPANLIPPDCATITPAMLPLVNLNSEEIARVIERVPGGVANVQDIYPLAPLQEGILFHHLMAKEGDPYLLVGLTSFDTRTRLDSYLSALQGVIQRHDVLRTAVVWEGVPEPLQVVWRNAPLVQEELILDPADGDVARQLRARFDPRHTRLDLSQAPLIRTSFAYDPVQQRWVMLTLMHHLISDHTTLEVVRAEIGAHLQGQETLLPVPLQFRNYVAQARLGSATALHENFFRTMLGEVDETTAPFGLLEVHGDGSGVEEGHVQLDAALSQRLRRQARQLGVSAASLCHMAWALVLARVANRRDVVFGTVLFGRMQGGEGSDRMMGLLVNTLPLRINIAQQGAADSVQHVHALLADLMEHEHASLALAQRASAIAAPQPLFSALLNYRHGAQGEASPAELATWQGISQISGEERSNYPLSLSVDDLGSGFALTAQVTPEIGARRVCSFMETALEGLVSALETTPQRAINSIDVLPAAERHQIVITWNAAHSSVPALALPQLFEVRAAETPDALAVVHGAQQLSYAELNRQANQLAHYLYESGVRPADRVALHMDRCTQLIVAELAILKCGAAYVPIDPALPDERKIFMANDSGIGLVLALNGGRWPSLAGVLRINLDDAAVVAAASAHATGNPTPNSDDESIAYIMYTSGSTGQPKGVMVPHRGIKCLVLENNYAAFNASDRLAFAANPAFDASTMEIWAALLNGARIVVIDKDVFLDPLRLAERLEQQGVTTLFLTTAVFNQCAAIVPGAFSKLRYLLTGGERCDPQAFARVMEAGKPQHLIHCYGPTEATTYATTYEVSAIDAGRETIPIGRPLANTQVYLLDAQGEPVPVGVAGEICIGGMQVACGYRNRAELTAERFVADRFSGKAGALLYRTGDLARWQADGNLVHLGRNDFQVKIRGFRIEMGEIESQLAAHPAIHEAVVIAREDTPGDKRLVAYIVAKIPANEGDASTADDVAGELDAEALRAYLSINMPDYMVPAAYVMLAALPLTVNGKLDRKHLPAPDSDAYAVSGYVAPQGETETALAAIWSELLQIGRVGRHDNFFSLGGHSLLAIQLISRLRHAFNVEVAVSTLFAHPLLFDFSTQLLASSVSVRPQLTASIGAERELLSFAQQRLWFLEQMGGISHAYHIPLALQLRGELDRVALVQALERVIFRHEALRTRFVAQEGLGAIQQVMAAETTHFQLIEHDLRHHPERDEERERLIAEDAATPFDLAQGPLIRGRLLQETRTQHTLLITTHHIVSDGWSTALLINEISALYNAYCEGRHDPLPALTIQYPDYAAWQRRWMRGAVLEQQTAYWKQSLAGAPTLLELPTDYPRPPQQDYAGASVDIVLDASLTRQLKSLSQRHGATLYMTLLGSWALLMGRLAGQDDVVIGTPAANRSQQEVEGLIGFFVNTLALRINLPRQANVAMLLAHVKEQSLAAQQYQEVPFEQVVEHAHPVRSMAHSPLFQVMFAWQNAPQGDLQLAGLELAPLAIRHATAKFDLTLSLGEAGEHIAGSLEYATALFERGTVERYLGYWRRLLQAMVSDDMQQIARLPLLDQDERQRVLTEWNATQVSYPDRERLLHQLCEAQAERTPQAVAVQQGEQQLSYVELNRQANQLAHYLRELGVQPDDRVAICVERSLAMVVGLLAVLKAGAAYVPLDPAYPADRLAHMLADSAPRVVLTQDGISGAWQQVRATIAADLPLLDLQAPGWSSYPDHNPDSRHLQSSDLAYVIYTSGSTGKPKGVMNEHSGVVNRMLWMQQAYGLAPHDVVLQKTPFSFDVSVWEFFWPLMVGAKLVMAKPDGHKDPAYLSEIIRSAGVTTLHFVPSMLQVFAAHEEARNCSSIVRVMCSGEALPASLANSFQQLLPQAGLHNLYGPTEAAVDVTAWTCVAGDTRSLVPIGKPIANTSIYILDNEGEPVPVGVAGELHIGGVQVARGYLNQPGLTEQRFVPDRFSSLSGARLYKSGDLARWQPDGTLAYLGRNDFQVKIRGFRIELGEIETQLAAHPAIREVVVLAREDVAGDKRLVAYLVVNMPVEIETLRAHLSINLPDYMVPAAYVMLAELPLTANGKLDRKSMPAPAGDAYAASGYVAPQGETEIALAAIWSELLQTDRISRHDNFFSLGGHSLLAVQMISRLRKAFGVEVALNTVFMHPFLADFAARLSGSDTRIRPVMTAISGAEREVLSFAQQRLWFLEQMGEVRQAYHVPLGLQLRGELDRVALIQALERLVYRHEALRTRFVVKEGAGAIQQITAADLSHFHLVEHDLRHHPERDAERERLIAEEAALPFDLAQGPLIRGRLLQEARTQHTLLITMHHIVSDGWSLGVLLNEISALYSAYHQGEYDPLPALTVQYPDYAAWQRRWMSGAVLEQQIAYWKQSLEGAPGLLELPTDYSRPLQQDYAGAWVETVLDEDLTKKLKSLSQRHGNTLHMTLMSSWALLLGRLAGQDDVVIGTPTANRNQQEVEGLIGFFVNTLALRIRLPEQATVAMLLTQVRQQSLAAQQHQEIPFEQVVEHTHPVRSLAHSPLFQVMFAWQNAPQGALHLPGLELTHLPFKQMTSKFDLTLSLGETGDTITGVLEYATALFERSTIERYLGYWHRLLEAMVRDETQQIARLPLLGETERHQIVKAWNTTAAHLPAPALPQLFEAQAAKAPDALAAVHGAAQLSYAELNRQANQLAHYLRTLGVKPADRVALHLDRSLQLIVAELAILKCGASYVPIDPSLPDERKIFMASDSSVGLVLAMLGDEWPALASVTRIDLDDAAVMAVASAHATVNLAPGSDDESIAYIMYTSGSTGQPKGVLVPQRGIKRLVLDNGYAAFDASDRIAFAANPAFDASTMEIWGALLNGGRIVVIDKDVFLDSLRFAVALEQHGVTTLFLTTAVFNQCAAVVPEAFSKLRYLLTGGERCDPLAFASVMEAGKPQHLIHCYGPTETTTYATTYEVERLYAGQETIPIGRPLANTEVYLLDAQGEPVPVGVAGEIYIGGAGVACGYLNRAELTAERFVADRFSGRPGALLYRTGDLGRWQADGNLVHLGRNDFQVKIRGFRIELGEIEARLVTHPAIREAVVIAREDKQGDKRLVAYIVTDEDGDAEALRSHLSAGMPEYMVPAAYVRLAALPLTPNGKLDRKSLPAPDTDAYAVAGYLAPEGEIESALAEIWSELLQIPQVGRHDNFFALGGHSLSILQVVTLLKKKGARISASDVFTYPTVAALAEHIAQMNPLETENRAVLVRSGGRQRPLFMMHEGSGLLIYAHMLALHIDPGIPVYGLPPVPSESTPLLDVQSMAARMLGLIREVQPNGPYRVAGWSFGGILAYEVAQQFISAGEQVEFIGLFDTHCAIGEDEEREEKLGDKQLMLALLQAAASNDPLRQAAMDKLKAVSADVDIPTLLQMARRNGLFPSGFSLQGLLQLMGNSRTLIRAYADYAAQPISIPVHLYSAEGDTVNEPLRGWGRVLSELQLRFVPVPGTHQSMMISPHIEVFAQALNGALQPAVLEGRVATLQL